MIKLEQVHPVELNNEDISWLIRACLAVKYERFEAKAVVERALKGIVELYRIVGDVRGMLAVRIGEDELFLECFGGSNVLRHFDEVHEQLKTLARAVGKSKLTTMVSRPGVKRLYETRTKARPAATYYVEQLG